MYSAFWVSCSKSSLMRASVRSSQRGVLARLVEGPAASVSSTRFEMRVLDGVALGRRCSSTEETLGGPSSWIVAHSSSTWRMIAMMTDSPGSRRVPTLKAVMSFDKMCRRT